ncbi:hypothetical protein HQO83_17305 [Rhodococcus fascians]|nr:hypothetical protein [Rhodococcus fascians]
MDDGDEIHAGPTLSTIDELDYLPLPGEAASAPFELSRNGMNTSIVMTTDPRVGSWVKYLVTTPPRQPCSTVS